MTGIKVVVHAEDTAPLADQLRRAHPDTIVETCGTYDGLPDLIERFAPDIVFGIRFAGNQNFPRDALMANALPKWVHVGGSGTDHLGQWDPGQKTVTNSAGVAAGMMAEYCLGAMLHFSLDVPGLMADKKDKVWQARQVSPLAGKTVLVIGLGNTGQALARLCKAIGMSVLGTRANPRPTPGVDEVYGSEQLPGLFGRSDYVVVCVPLLESTRGLLAAAAFQTMRRGTVLVDLSRGGIVKERDLLVALEDGTLAGAALDVFESEPLPSDSPLWRTDNVLISPHCSSVYEGWEASSMEMFCENLTRWKDGEPLRNLVTPGKP